MNVNHGYHTTCRLEMSTESYKDPEISQNIFSCLILLKFRLHEFNVKIASKMVLCNQRQSISRLQ